MSEASRITTVRAVMREALSDRTSEAWTYLPATSSLGPDTPCLVQVNDEDEEEDDRGIPLSVIRQRFPHQGLDWQTLTSVADWTLRFRQVPDDQLLFESFHYYLRFDAFLPSPGAPDPPSLAESRARSDSEFLARLGPEDPARPCAARGCLNGAGRLSVLCGEHHFENIHGRAVAKN